MSLFLSGFLILLPVSLLLLITNYQQVLSLLADASQVLQTTQPLPSLKWHMEAVLAMARPILGTLLRLLIPFPRSCLREMLSANPYKPRCRQSSL